MYKIEKNVPVPHGWGKVRDLRNTLNTLEVDESFLLPVKDYQTFHSAKRSIIDKFIMASRIDDKHFRIFRIR